MADGVQIATADTSDFAALSRTLAAAFADDPVFAWLIPDERRRAAALERLFAVEGRRIALRHGRSVQATATQGPPVGTETSVPVGTETSVPVGAAFVLPPGHWRTPVRVEVACAGQ